MADEYEQELLEHLAWCAFDHDCEEAVAELFKETIDV